MTRKKDQIIRILQASGVVLIATDTVYGLAALPADRKAVAKIYRLKERPVHLHLPVMVASASDLERLGADLNVHVRKLLRSRFVPGAITFVLGFKDETLKPAWLQGRDEIAVRIPDNALLLSVLQETGPLLVTSANRHGQARTPDRVADILKELNGAPDWIVEDGKGREIPSTILNCRHDPPVRERAGIVSLDAIDKILHEDE
jgi:L-threonylcarbamoyladenylate synthase